MQAPRDTVWPAADGLVSAPRQAAIAHATTRKQKTVSSQANARVALLLVHHQRPPSFLLDALACAVVVVCMSCKSGDQRLWKYSGGTVALVSTLPLPSCPVLTPPSPRSPFPPTQSHSSLNNHHRRRRCLLVWAIKPREGSSWAEPPGTT